MLDPRVTFACPSCGRPVTRPLAPLPGGVELATGDGEPAVPEGFFAVADEDWAGVDGCPLVHLANLVDVGHHPDPHRHAGCCGRDGLDGPNLTCAAGGHEVGTERSDCWMTHVAVLLPNVGREGSLP